MKENDCLHVQGNSTLLNSRSQQRDFDFTPRSNHTGNTHTHTYSFATSLWTVSTSVEWITTLHDNCVQTERTWITKGIKISALSCRALGLFGFFFSMASILPLVSPTYSTWNSIFPFSVVFHLLFSTFHCHLDPLLP